MVGHHDCGMTNLDPDAILAAARQRGVDAHVIDTLRSAGIDLPHWLSGFTTPADGVRQSVATIRNHPLLPRDLPKWVWQARAERVAWKRQGVPMEARKPRLLRALNALYRESAGAEHAENLQFSVAAISDSRGPRVPWLNGPEDSWL